MTLAVKGVMFSGVRPLVDWPIDCRVEAAKKRGALEPMAVGMYDWIFFDYDDTLNYTSHVYNEFWREHITGEVDHVNLTTKQIIKAAIEKGALVVRSDVEVTEEYLWNELQRRLFGIRAFPLEEFHSQVREAIMLSWSATSAGRRVLWTNAHLESVMHSWPELTLILDVEISNMVSCDSVRVGGRAWEMADSRAESRTALKSQVGTWEMVEAKFHGRKLIIDDSLATCEMAISRGWDAIHVPRPLGEEFDLFYPRCCHEFSGPNKEPCDGTKVRGRCHLWKPHAQEWDEWLVAAEHLIPEELVRTDSCGVLAFPPRMRDDGSAIAGGHFTAVSAILDWNKMAL